MSHTVTLELPDIVYQKFRARSQQTKRSLEEELLTAFALDLPVLPMTETNASRAYDEVIEFLSSGPPPIQIVQFRLSDEAERRAHSLLFKEREQRLTHTEAQELDFYIELGDFLGILRAKAQLQLQENSFS